MDRNVLIQEYRDILEFDKMPEELKKYLNSPSLLRLKNISYFCGMKYASSDVYDFKENVSRYDHSLFVALITWKLTRNFKATLAGLFHDISTPCFSHVIDYMNKDYDKQESTEEKTEEVIVNDKHLVDCLNQDNIKISEIVNFKDYSIVDLERPMLCADRLDGVILTGLVWTKNINIDDVRKIVDDIIVLENEYQQDEIGFNNREIVDLVVRTSELIDKYFHSLEDNYMMDLLAKITKRAIDLGIVTYDQLFILDEEELFRLLDNSLDLEIKNNLDLFRNIKSSDIHNIDIPFVKIRDLNPLVSGVRYKNLLNI